MKTPQLRPRVLVSYVREPYVYAAGNVRVTFDSNIRTSLFQREFLNGALPDIIATDTPGDIILEVKYDEFLPSYLQAVLSGVTAQRSAVSKYTWCRRYENKEF